jgi:hypothetical protein
MNLMGSPEQAIQEVPVDYNTINQSLHSAIVKAIEYLIHIRQHTAAQAAAKEIRNESRKLEGEGYKSYKNTNRRVYEPGAK